MINTLIYSNNIAVAELSGKRVTSNLKPTFSFDYDELQYHQTNKGYVFQNNWSDLNAEQELEINNFLEDIVVDDVLGGKVSSNMENVKYLYDTDWYITRNTETGIAIPADILEKRAAARLAIEDLSSYTSAG